MATSTFHQALERLRETRVWKSIFRRGPARTNRTRSLAVFGNLFLHFLPVKVREKSLRVRASYYLGSISFLLFIVLTVTGVLLMFYYHPAVPQAYRDMKDLHFVVSNGVFLAESAPAGRAIDGSGRCSGTCSMSFTAAATSRRTNSTGSSAWCCCSSRCFLSYTGYLLPWDQLAFWAITVGTNIISAMPFMGGKVRFEFALGGNWSAKTPCCASMFCTASCCRLVAIALHRRSFLARAKRRRPDRARRKMTEKE